MKFTKQEKIYEIGDAIYPTDMSALHRKEADSCFLDAHDDEYEVREKLRDGHPFIVISEPYLKRNIGWFENEYYIDVKFDDSDVVYCIFNSSTNVFTDYWEMLEFIADCEECAAFGY